jgi:hypothetical protein
MEILALIVGVLVGIAVGFVLTVKFIRGLQDEDCVRLSAIELFGWTVARSNGRWAVLKDTDSEMKVIGSTQPTLRQAIDAAVEIERTSS